MSAKEFAIGIDFGTAWLRAAVVGASGQPEIISGPLGERAVPAVVAFARRRDGLPAIFVGTPARRQASANPKQTIFGAKRLLGRRLDDPQVARWAVGVRAVAGPGGAACIEIDGKPASPEEIAAQLLASLKTSVEQQLGGRVGRAVLAVPAGFDHAQRRALSDAAEIAGLPVDRLISAPAAIALGCGLAAEPARRYALCDVGAGGFEVAVLSVEDGVVEVLAQAGDEGIGGDELDRRLADKLASEARGVADHEAWLRLRDEAERLKQVLAVEAQAVLQTQGAGGQPFVRAVRRLELEVWTKDLVDRLDAVCRAALDGAGVAVKDLEQVILAGSGWRTPAIARKLEQIFGRPLRREANADELAVLGAAACAAARAGQLQEAATLEISPRSLGFDSGSGRFAPVIPRHALLPAREERIFPTRRDGQREIAIELYEGDFVDVTRDRRLARLVVGDLPAAPAGEILALVELTLDVDGRLRVAARELGSGAPASARLELARGLDRAEVRRLTTLNTVVN